MGHLSLRFLHMLAGLGYSKHGQPGVPALLPCNPYLQSGLQAGEGLGPCTLPKLEPVLHSEPFPGVCPWLVTRESQVV